MEVDYTNLVALLTFLATPASAVVVGMFISDALRNAQWMGKLTSFAQQLVVAGLTILVTVGATVLLQVVTPDQFAVVQPYFALVSSVALSLISGRITFEVAKRRELPYG